MFHNVNATQHKNVLNTLMKLGVFIDRVCLTLKAILIEVNRLVMDLY